VLLVKVKFLAFFNISQPKKTMRKADRNYPELCAFGILACLGCSEGAATIFTENFSGYSGTQNATQYQTGLNVAYGGNVFGWSNLGDGTMHAVDLSGSGNWAIMLWQNNVITQTVGIAANDSGSSYEVNFDYGTAVYADERERTLSTDALLVELLRSNDSVLASQFFFPGAWDDTGNQNLDRGLQGTLPYVGDGTGDLRLRIGPAPATFNQGHFAGEIDNLSVNLIPEPSTYALLVMAVVGLGAQWWRRGRKAV
jgi:hypothetical protein